MTLEYLLAAENQSDQKPRIVQDIADNGLKILNRDGYLRNKPITKTAVYRLKNGIGRLYYFNAENKVMAGGYTVVNVEKENIPIIGEYIDEPLED